MCGFLPATTLTQVALAFLAVGSSVAKLGSERGNCMWIESCWYYVYVRMHVLLRTFCPHDSHSSHCQVSPQNCCLHLEGEDNFPSANKEGIEQKPATVGDRIVHRVLSPKRCLFKLGLVDSPRCESCLENECSVTHIPCNCEAGAYLSFCYMDHYYVEPSNYRESPIRKVPHFIRSIGLIEG